MTRSLITQKFCLHSKVLETVGQVVNTQSSCTTLNYFCGHKHVIFVSFIIFGSDRSSRCHNVCPSGTKCIKAIDLYLSGSIRENSDCIVSTRPKILCLVTEVFHFPSSDQTQTEKTDIHPAPASQLKPARHHQETHSSISKFTSLSISTSKRKKTKHSCQNISFLHKNRQLTIHKLVQLCHVLVLTLLRTSLPISCLLYPSFVTQFPLLTLLYFSAILSSLTDDRLAFTIPFIKLEHKQTRSPLTSSKILYKNLNYYFLGSKRSKK